MKDDIFYQKASESTAPQVAPIKSIRYSPGNGKVDKVNRLSYYTAKIRQREDEDFARHLKLCPASELDR